MGLHLKFIQNVSISEGFQIFGRGKNFEIVYFQINLALKHEINCMESITIHNRFNCSNKIKNSNAFIPDCEREIVENKLTL